MLLGAGGGGRTGLDVLIFSSFNMVPQATVPLKLVSSVRQDYNNTRIYTLQEVISFPFFMMIE